MGFFFTALTKTVVTARLKRHESITAKSKAAPKKSAQKVKNTFYSEVEISLKNELGRKVNIKPTSNGRGTITIEFYSDDELADFAKKIVGE